MKSEEYGKMAKQVSRPSPLGRDCFFAFVIGGGICVFGQALSDIYTHWLSMEKQDATTLVSITLIFLSALLTGLGVYQKVAKIAGAGTLVPITGFANAMVSPALEFKTEGYILGLGSKLFTVAGPVLVYGTLASFIYGIIYYIIKLF